MKVLPAACRLLALAVAVLLASALPAGAAGQTGSFPLGIFATYLSDELQGPLFGPVKKVTIRNGGSSWSAAFAPGGQPLARELLIPGLTHEILTYEAGRVVKRVHNPGTAQESVCFIRYNEAGRSFSVLFPTRDGSFAEAGSGTLTPQGLIAAKSLRLPDGSPLFDIASEYNAAGLPVREVARYARHGAITVERSYDDSGRILRRTQINSPLPDGPVSFSGASRIEYRYDSQGRLTEAVFQTTASATALAIQGSYDRYGNWIKLVMTRRNPAPEQAPAVFTQEIEYY